MAASVVAVVGSPIVAASDIKINPASFELLLPASSTPLSQPIPRPSLLFYYNYIFHYTVKFYVNIFFIRKIFNVNILKYKLFKIFYANHTPIKYVKKLFYANHTSIKYIKKLNLDVYILLTTRGTKKSSLMGYSVGANKKIRFY